MPEKKHPKRGDRVALRGRGKSGVLKTMDDDSNWVCVDWDISGPKICHLFELQHDS